MFICQALFKPRPHQKRRDQLLIKMLNMRQNLKYLPCLSCVICTTLLLLLHSDCINPRLLRVSLLDNIQIKILISLSELGIFQLGKV